MNSLLANRNTIARQPSKQPKRTQDGLVDETKQTFIEKLRGYQQFADVNKVKQRQAEQIRRKAQRIKQKLSFQIISPRNSSPNGLLLIRGSSNDIKGNINVGTNRTPTNIYQKQSPKLNSQTIPSGSFIQIPSLSFMTTKFTTHQNNFNQQLQSIINDISATYQRHQQTKQLQQQRSRQNYLSLDQFEKYLMLCQNEHQKEYNMVFDKTKEEITEIIQARLNSGKQKHKLALEEHFKTLKIIDQQEQLLKQGIINQTQLCEADWCMELDKCNDHLLGLNNLIAQVREEETERFSDLQWRVKEVQFSCEDMLQSERKNRLNQEHKIYAVIEQLIIKVGGVQLSQNQQQKQQNQKYTQIRRYY